MDPIQDYIVKNDGVVTKITEDRIFVAITCHSACAGCGAKRVCNMAEMAQKELELPRDEVGEAFNSGDKVTVLMRQSLGFYAVFLGYFLPFLILILTLVLGSMTIDEEAVVGLASLGILVPYYLILYLFRHRLKKAFKFKLMPTSR